jgi:hypothetical protein
LANIRPCVIIEVLILSMAERTSVSPVKQRMILILEDRLK